jgi:hypothetical protein
MELFVVPSVTSVSSVVQFTANSAPARQSPSQSPRASA